MNEPQTDNLTYDGSFQPQAEDQAARRRLKRPFLQPYLPAADLVKAVELAIFLKRPLLLRGEPGCGKSRLAEAVAFELAKRNTLAEWPFEFWPVKSTSRARDGLYIFDAVSRLRDAQLAAAKVKSGEETAVPLRNHEDIQQYVKDGPLGRAFKNKRRTIVLIDEIDKADIDFPNDLLIELDERRFKVDELSRFRENGAEEEFWVEAEAEPIIFITSNHEKELPDAFLRRCVFFYIDFPDTSLLQNIVAAHCLDATPTTDEMRLVAEAVRRFERLREELAEGQGEAGKLVSTSELIDWFKVMRHRHTTAEALTLLADETTLPYRAVLLKNREALNRYIEPGMNS
jgi:MoxR-like ATPase